MSVFRWLAACVLALFLPAVAFAQPPVLLKTRGTSGTISANGGSVTLTDTGGLAGLTIQTLDSYSGTWEAQCSTDGGTTFDTDDEIVLVLMGDTAGTPVVSVTDAVGIWQANISGCNAVKVIATAGFAASDTTVSLQACSTCGATTSGASTVDTEMPAAGALADDTANPTVPGVAAFMMCFDGTTWDRCQTTRDPCDGALKTFIPISIVTATTTEITPSLAGASTNYYICSINLVTAGANNVLVADDDTDNCASPTSGIFGSDASPAAGEGWNFAANGGIALGNGQGMVGKTNGTNRVICIITSAAVQLSGGIAVVAAP